MHDDLTNKQSWQHGGTEKSLKQNGANVEQTKILVCAEQLELKRTSKCVMVAAVVIWWLGMIVVLPKNGHCVFRLLLILWQTNLVVEQE